MSVCQQGVRRTCLNAAKDCAISLQMITAEQCRAARGLLKWSQSELAEKAGIGIVTVRQLEAGASEPRRATLEVVERAFRDAGIDFIAANGGGLGVRFK